MFAAIFEKLFAELDKLPRLKRIVVGALAYSIIGLLGAGAIVLVFFLVAIITGRELSVPGLIAIRGNTISIGSATNDAATESASDPLNIGADYEEIFPSLYTAARHTEFTKFDDCVAEATEIFRALQYRFVETYSESTFG